MHKALKEVNGDFMSFKFTARVCSMHGIVTVRSGIKTFINFFNFGILKTSKALTAQRLAASHSLSFFKAIANSSSSSITISSIFEMFLNTFPQKMLKMSVYMNTFRFLISSQINIAVQCLSTDFSSQKGVKLY
ncbi:hypothetical protein GQX74_011825 [Glossina fuscipes]|nr:hypothetical protein GQX74_011825 [Glossina fuscipes]